MILLNLSVCVLCVLKNPGFAIKLMQLKLRIVSPIILNCFGSISEV